LCTATLASLAHARPARAAVAAPHAHPRTHAPAQALNGGIYKAIGKKGVRSPLFAAAVRICRAQHASRHAASRSR
jgi:hypothetical protein